MKKPIAYDGVCGFWFYSKCSITMHFFYSFFSSLLSSLYLHEGLSSGISSYSLTHFLIISWWCFGHTLDVVSLCIFYSFISSFLYLQEGFSSGISPYSFSITLSISLFFFFFFKCIVKSFVKDTLKLVSRK